MKLGMPEMPSAILLNVLGANRLLPAIIFLPTRRRCDQAASEAAFNRRDPDAERREARRSFVRSFVAEHPEVRGHRHWDTIISGGVASHHAGHIPAWKLVIEKLMSAGLLDAIFATATVAAGVDFPARTVVLTVADARSNRGWRPLTASELQQMTGRAGRRGRDNVGFIVAAPGAHQDPQRIAQLLKAPPDPLVSQFRATYTTLLNLLDAYGDFAHVRDIAGKSFAHRGVTRHLNRIDQEVRESEQRITEILKRNGCSASYSAAFALERLVSARARLHEKRPQTRGEVLSRWLDEVVRPGRVVAIGRSGKRLVMVTHRYDGKVQGVREDGRGASFPLERIGRVYSPGYALNETGIEEGFKEVHERGSELVIPEPRLRDSNADEFESLKFFDDAIDSLLSDAVSGSDEPLCKEALWATIGDAGVIEQSRARKQALEDEIWEPFERRARVLASFGYLDFNSEKVTERGRWLADLHVDHPLIIGEALESGLFQALNPVQMGAVTAAITADEDRDYGEIELDDGVVGSLSRFEETGFRVASEEWKYGIEPAPELNLSAAGAAGRWSSGTEWPVLVKETRAEEGDLFRMLSRTGEALLQVAGLRGAHPQAAKIAARTAEIILREPVR